MAKGKMSTKQAVKQALKKKKKKPATKPIEIIKESENIPEIVDVSNENYDIKGEFTLRELRFIHFYLSGQVDGKKTIEESMILAGYENVGETYRRQLGRNIIRKYECQTDDHRKIFRAVGAGETAVAQGLLTLAQTAKSEMVRLNAWTALAKCLGLTKEVVEGVEGIQIVINSSRGLAKPGEPPKDLPPTSGSLQITE
jgi:hypothetical protein